MKHRIRTFCGLVLYAAVSYAQEPPSKLKSFFEKRLSDTVNTPPPSYEALLAVIDSIRGSTSADIQSALPLLSVALNSKIPNVGVEAVFAFFEISRRPDGGGILRNHVLEIAPLMANPDERLGGGSVTILRNLTGSIPDITIPLMMNELQSSRQPSVIKAEIVRTLLESSKRNDQQVLRAVEAYLSLNADPPVRTSNLYALAANRINTPAITNHVIKALDDKNKTVQIAAIQTVYARKADLMDLARPIILKLSNDPNADQEVRSVATKAINNQLDEPRKVQEAPQPPKLKGATP